MPDASPGSLDARARRIAACRGWTPKSLAIFYETIYQEQGFKFLEFLWPVAMGFCDWRINKLMFIVGPGCGKSQMLSVTIPAWMVGHDPNMTILGISGGEALMQGFQAAVMELIQDAPIWREIFPEINPDYRRGWSLMSGMYVTGRKHGNPDASYLAAGISSKFLTGKHAKLLVIDDIHNEENSATAESCDKVVQSYAKTIVGRADPMGARFLMAGRRWHLDDIYGQLQTSPGADWVVITIPHERKGQKRLYADIHVPDGLECVFTDKRCQLPDGSFCSAFD
jgi:hypothetical protein